MNITIPDAAALWVNGGDTGLSSKAIWSHMIGTAGASE